MITCLAFTGSGWGPTALAQQPTQPTDATTVRVDDAFSWLVSMRATLDRAQFDVEALSFELAFEEPATIVDWVRSRIDFEPYRGVLRGADGVLQSGAGNTLDQALLLATLLKDSGLDARIVRGTLDLERATALLDAVDVGVPKQVVSASDVETVWLDHLVSFGGLFDLSPDETRERLEELTVERSARSPGSARAPDAAASVAAEANAILSAVRSGTDRWRLLEDDAHETLLEDVRDYFWVQYRLGDGAWVDAHVVGEVPPEGFAGVAVEEAYDDTVPEDLLHRFRFQAFLEIRVGDELRVEPLMDPWERPVANLIAVPLSYSSHPTAMGDLTRFEHPVDVLDDVQFFAPVWNDDVAEGGRFFDAWGNLVDPDVADQAAAGVFAAVGRGFAQALGAVGGDEAVPVVTAHFIEYTFLDAAGRQDVHRRYLYDGFAHERASLERAERSASETVFDHEVVSKSLYDAVTFMIAPGSFKPEAVLDMGLTALLDARPAVEAVLSMDGGDTAIPSVDTASAGSAATFLALFTDLESIAASFEEGRSYRPAPALVAYEQGIAFVGDEWRLHQGIDVVSDPRWFVRRVDGHLVRDNAMRVMAGVWTTWVEARHLEAIARASGIGDTFAQTASQAFGRLTRAAAEPPLVITSLAEMDADRAVIPASAVRAARDDLERGYVLVVPSEQDPAETFSWWRVDPATGETLGRLENGRGGVLLEYVKTWFAGFTVAMTACLMTSWTARYLVLAATDGKGDLKSVVKPRDFVRCTAFSISFATFRANVIAPKFGLQAGAGPGGVIYSHRGINTIDTSVLGLGFAFVTGLLGEFVVPSDWPSEE